MHHHHAKFFKTFLVIYLLFSIYMLSEHNFGTWIGAGGITLGILVAILAHSRYGYLTIGLLLVHMCIEWFEHAHGWRTYSSGELWLNGIHVSLDFIFLFQELRVHATRWWKISFASVVVAIVLMVTSITLLNPITENSTDGHDESGSIVESFVVGGMFGCILSHLFRRKDECGHSHD